MTVDWKKMARVQPELIGDVRSCRNCAHRVGFGQHTYYWDCARIGGRVALALSPEGPCGPDARLWGPRPAWWRRWFLSK